MTLVQNQIKREIEKQSILKHPFYQLWNEGKLSIEALRVYSKQYFHFVNRFPALLETMLVNCENPAIRRQILENLREEKKHPALWLAFANSLGLTNDEVSSSELLPETAESLRAFQSFMKGSTSSAAAALLTYEAQVPEVARQKMEGLMKFYGIEAPEALEFFRVHMQVDLDHVKVWEKILSDTSVNQDILDVAEQSLQVQWRLLDGVLRVSQSTMICEDHPVS